MRIEKIWLQIQHFEVLIRANSTNGLKKDSKILLNRVRAIDKKLRLRDYCGVASEETMEQVSKGLELVLNIKKRF
jgi:mRNA-degrading endonuclease toxin of MazEF toxin-antitoxin module